MDDRWQYFSALFGDKSNILTDGSYDDLGLQNKDCMAILAEARYILSTHD